MFALTTFLELKIKKQPLHDLHEHRLFNKLKLMNYFFSASQINIVLLKVCTV